MHYVKMKTRVRVYMHDLRKNQQKSVLNHLNRLKIDYRYIERLSCITVPLKHEHVIYYICSDVFKNSFIPNFCKKQDKKTNKNH